MLISFKVFNLICLCVLQNEAHQTVLPSLGKANDMEIQVPHSLDLRNDFFISFSIFSFSFRSF